jgi:CBS domain-containing protein
MESPIKTAEQLLQYRPLRRILADKGGVVHAVGPDDTVFAAVEQMATHDVGFLIVLDQERLVGVLSERDCARRVLLKGRTTDTPVHDVMTGEVVTVGPDQTLPQCMALMHGHALRHLPVVDQGSVIGVLSMRDLLAEIVEHHERVIRDLEIERMSMMTGGSTY